MRLVLDEHYSLRIAQQLRQGGFDVIAVTERPTDLRQLDDESLLRWAHLERRVLVTENAQDFLPIHGQFLSQGEGHSGIVLTSPEQFSRSSSGIGRLVHALTAFIERHGDTGALASDVQWLQAE